MGHLKPQFVGGDVEVVTFKYEDDIVRRFRGYIDADPDKASDQAVALAVVKVESDLLNYYATSNGQRDIAKSPHHGKDEKEIVALLMQDVYHMGRAEIIHRELKRQTHG